ncbi:PVC-type heme-binding CxxCH protein [Verrucomicrobiales bacterium BCK34]|nr:PVC-type heme-binding CxxCH protein [Verrucomicrobiales bacterium BCK34]
MRIFSAFLASLLVLVISAQSEELPSIYKDDFSKGAENWTPTDAKAWKITEVDGNQVFENLGGSKYEAPYRSPHNIALLNEHIVGDFVLTARVQSKQEPRDHRDMCLFFGYQDPANFYYVHLGQKADPHANQIFLVNEAPRIAISEKYSEGTPWKSDIWHEVKIVRTVATGLIEIYFDDMENPSHVAHDKTFAWGQIGIGTFDDKGLWDDIELRGVKVVPPKSEQASPKQLKFTKWTPDFQVPDPVAISFDPQGRAYVTQTQRRKANDLDIRQNADWIPDDLSFTSPKDKEDFYKAKFTEANSTGNAHRVKDFTGDGIHDIRDLTALSERIHFIADEDGDGFADTIQTYAEDLDHLIGGVAGGVLFHEGSVYTCPVPEMVRFRDTDGDGKADEKKVMASGFGVHLAYAGHDMHGLRVGPDGRIYWSVGDKGIRVKTADGLDYRFPNQGGLMRCEPDGSNFEVYAHGQRNIQEVDFDQYGNFFGVDNDADLAGENERLVFIEQYLETGWRSNWQYLKEDYNPWDDDLMHKPWHEEQPRWFTPPLSNYENGPAGFKFNPGTALGGDYQNYFFLTSAPRGEQWAFQVRPHGDSFKMVNDHKIAEGVPLVGLNFAPDGALYGVDWGGGYPLNEEGGIWRIDVAKEEANVRRGKTKALIAADFSKMEVGELVALLADPDQRIRLKAQFQLATLKESETLMAQAAKVEADQFSRIHAIWGVGQLIRAGEADPELLTALFTDPDPEIRAQAIKTATDGFGVRLGLDRIPAPGGKAHPLTELLVARLNDPSQKVRMQALIGLGRLGDVSSSEAILEMLRRKEHQHSMVYARHAGVMAMAGAIPTEKLAGLKEDKSDFVRACAVVALRRRGDAAVTAFLTDKDPVTAGDAARAIHDDWMIPEALPSLAAALGTHSGNEAFTRRAINANFRIGDAKSADRVAAFIAAGKGGEVNLEAGLEALQNWTKPGKLDLVVGRSRPLEPRDAAVASGAIKKHIDALLTSEFASVRTTTMKLARQADLTIKNETLETVFSNQSISAKLRAEALRTLASQKAPGLDKSVTAGLGDQEDTVRMAALDILVSINPKKAVEAIKGRVEGDGSVLLKQHAIRQLPKVKASALMNALVDDLAAGTLAPALQLDVFEAAGEGPFAQDEKVAAKLSALSAKWTEAAAGDMLAPFQITKEGGDAQRGESVFMNHEAAQCIRCHKVEDGKGSNVGPNLKSIGAKKDRQYILESLVDPQKVIAKGYGNISLTLKDGSSVAGQFRSEKDGAVTIRDIENKETVIAADKIESRSPVVSTMPPMAFILQKGELRDVIAYLASLKAE